MTRKDYILIGEALNECYRELEEDCCVRMYGKIVRELCQRLKGENARFNTITFEALVYKVD